MTLRRPPSPSVHRPIHHHRAFTLAELTIVLGIVIVLVAILVPTVSRARKKGIETFKVGLEQYHATWLDYPAIIDPSQVANPITMDADGINQVHIEDGAKALLTCLGLKLQVRAGSAPYGPFIDLSHFSIDTTNHWLMDPNGLPYIYIPATAPTSVITQSGRFVASVLYTSVTTANAPLYNTAGIPNNPSTATPYLSTSDMQVILGASSNGAAAQASYTGPFILWAAGPDQAFGFPIAGQYSTANSNPKTDDITNFTIPINLQQ